MRLRYRRRSVAMTYRRVGEKAVQPPLIEVSLAVELEKHKGRWVAVFDGQIVAVGDSASEVRDQSLAKQVTDPTLFRVPVNPHRIAYY
jgi:hypothetical protein